MLTVMLVNGASGVGKTTSAAILHERIKGSIWIHPDGLRPEIRNLTSEQILNDALDRLSWDSRDGVAIIDCQITGSAARGVVTQRPSIKLVNVLLTCSRSERERRLRNRTGPGYDTDRIEAWSQVLAADANRNGDLVIDTSAKEPDTVADELLGVLIS